VEYPVRVKVNRKTVVVTVAAVLSMAIGVAGALAYRSAQTTSYFGESAKQVADALRCAEYVSTRSKSTVADYRDQGTCRLGGYWVKITTFNNEAEERAFAILMNTLIPAYTHRGGAYAQGAGWNAADDKSLAREAAVQVAAKLGGTVHEFTATPATKRS
jgi:hypothetical protein